jgi:predicted transcriptional regulator
MKRKQPSKPTDAELAVLRVLWQRGPSTVREVWQELNPQRGTGYTTVLKIMQIMFDKGLLARDETARSHVYRAAHSQQRTQREVVGHLLERVFSGSALQLVMQALAAKKATRAELAEIRKLLDEIEGSSK